MPAITERPIIKSWAQDTSNKSTPSQTTIGTGIEYAAPLVSNEPNGAMFIVFEAAKNLQRTGGLYSPSIPYIEGQSCSLLCKIGTRYGIRRFICISATDISNTPPLTGATITTVNGVQVYSGGILSTSWIDADAMDGYASTTIDVGYNSALLLPGFAAVNVGVRQYVNLSNNSISVNPETNQDYVMAAPTLDSLLSMTGRLYYPPMQASAASITAYPIRRLGVYNFRGNKIEAFGMFLSGQAFTDNATSNQSRFWRSFSFSYASQCVIGNLTARNIFFTGTAGGTITPRDYRGRVPACDGTPVLSGGGTASARASLGAVQDDQMQGHWHDLTPASLGSGSRTFYSAAGTTGLLDTARSIGLARDMLSDGTNGTPRIGLNTRENTFTQMVPMVVSLLPYGQITL